MPWEVDEELWINKDSEEDSHDPLQGIIQVPPKQKSTWSSNVVF
jgi:hypothetical protein